MTKKIIRLIKIYHFHTLTEDTVRRSGAGPAGRPEEHHGPGSSAAAGGARDGGRVHDLRQPLGGAQDPGGVPLPGPAALPPSATAAVLQPAGGERRRPGLLHRHQVTELRALTVCGVTQAAG